MAFLSSSINPTYGFHPTLTVAFRLEDDLDCSLHLILTLPPLVFVDPYELGNYKTQYTFQHTGPSNLELPVIAVGDEPSYVLFNVSRSATTSGFAQIPLHLRYGEVGVEEFQSVNIPSPEAFLSCSASSGAPQ
ncbi:PIG-X [Mucidula mucida]|nr:PIG-X [Mucidula mucida]